MEFKDFITRLKEQFTQGMYGKYKIYKIIDILADEYKASHNVESTKPKSVNGSVNKEKKQ